MKPQAPGWYWVQRTGVWNRIVYFYRLLDGTVTTNDPHGGTETWEYFYGPVMAPEFEPETDSLFDRPLSRAERREVGSMTGVDDWLRGFLSDGPRPCGECKREGVRLGYTARAVHQASKRLGVSRRCYRHNKGKTTQVWELLSDDLDYEPDDFPEEAVPTIAELQHEEQNA